LILESFCRSKAGHDDGGDDRWAVVGDFAVVADGETHKDPFSDPGAPAASATTVIEEVSKLPSDITAFEAFAKISQGLRAKWDQNSNDRPGCSVVVFSKLRREIWRVGDCQFRIGEKLFRTEKRLDSIAAEVRAAYTESLICEGHTIDDLRASDPGRELVLPLIRRAKAFRNLSNGSEWSFATCDGSEIPEGGVEIFQIGDQSTEVVLASDGYPFLFATLAETEEALSVALSEDLLCIGRLRGTKGVKPGAESFDDRTYLRLQIDAS
jgi:hypothetical protein